MKKAARAADAAALEQIPNVGPSLAGDLRRIGIRSPQDLRHKTGIALYKALCAHDRVRHDPCVLDTFLAAVDFMNGGRPKPWWAFTAERKKTWNDI